MDYGFRVWLLRVSGDLFELTDGSPNAVVSRSEDGSGYQSGYWTPPETGLMVGYDHYLVVTYMREDGGSWVAKATHLSESLLYRKLYASPWNFTVYTEKGSSLLSFGDSTVANSKIEGVSMQDPLPQQLALYYGQSGDFVNMTLFPYVYIIGNLVYSLAFLLVGGAFYLKNRKLEIIIVLAVLFCGSQGIAAVIPDLAYRIIYVIILLVVTVMLYRVFR